MSRRTALASAAVAAIAAVAVADDVSDSPHNLSVSGPGPVKATAETEVCIFCHAPHNNSPQKPLWNRADPGATYTTYTSTTMKAAPGQPTGVSRQCLSCHDGTIALGRVVSRSAEIAMATGAYIPPGPTRLGTDISGDHPISFSYADSLSGRGSQLVAAPRVNGRSLLDAGGNVQCTSCHDPHDDRYGKFLLTDPRGGALCGACHVPPGWSATTHASSSAVWNGVAPNPWPDSSYTTVADNACGNCHKPHQAPGRMRLLRGAEEQDCLPCHDGNVAAANIAAELSKWTRHDVTATQGVHDRAEVPDGRRTHVECVDCHEPHSSNAQPAAGGLPGPLLGVNGYSAAGSPMAAATTEYEICFKCHADPADSDPKRIPRVLAQPSILRLFATVNPSFHPLEGVGRNPNVPSLLAPWTTASTVRCSDCLNNDAGPGAGGVGPAGPHGSRYDFILERNYTTSDPSAESATAYALCYKCHDRASILADQSFGAHARHVVTDQTACAVCHAPHGIDAAQGNSTNNSNLIDFDSRVVTRNAKGLLQYTSAGVFHGTCSLACHGHDHDQSSY